ncbi:MAG TPA: hypothetical protein VJU17_08345, partial [Gemmatimonadales bacterium]|nr:hypothetical protein [Gemmatimonadales bacterium]
MNSSRRDSPVNSDAATNSSNTANTNCSAGLVARECSSAPVRPPAALVNPKLHTTRRSTWPFTSQKRIAVPTRCGIETAATASLASDHNAK